MKIIDDYQHLASEARPNMPDPDPRPGNYYVSVRDNGRTALLRGPFPTHEAALAAVAETTRKACDLDPRACWYAFGTARAPDDVPAPRGKLNDYFTE